LTRVVEVSPEDLRFGNIRKEKGASSGFLQGYGRTADQKTVSKSSAFGGKKREKKKRENP